MTTKNYPHETEAFWQKHITAYQASNQSKAAYAKIYDLNYSRFLYWLDRRKSKHQQKNKKNNQTPKLLPIKIITNSPEKILASIKLADGYCIEIHEMSALLYLLKQT